MGARLAEHKVQGQSIRVDHRGVMRRRAMSRWYCVTSGRGAKLRLMACFGGEQ